MFLSKALTDLLGLHNDLPRTRCRGELDVQTTEVLFVHLDPLDLLQLLDPRLYLIRLGRLVAEAFDKLLGLLDHLLLVLIGRQLLGTTLSAQFDILAVRHPIVVNLPERYFDRPRRDVIQKGPVVRDQHNRPVIILQIIFEPPDTFDVEVVGRLIEQENRRTTQQQLRQLDPHTPSPAEFAGRAGEVGTLETQPEQCLFDLLLAVHSTQNIESVRRVVEAMQQFFILGAFVIGPFGNLGIQPVDFAFQSEHLGECRFGLVEKGRRIGYLHLLGQIPHRALPVTGNRARCRLLLPDQHLQHRRLTGSVLPYQPDPILFVDQERYILKQIPSRKTDRQIIYRNHRLLSLFESLLTRFIYIHYTFNSLWIVASGSGLANTVLPATNTSQPAA